MYMFSRFKHTHTHACTAYSHISGQWEIGTEEKVFKKRKFFKQEKGFCGRFKRTDSGGMTGHRNRELVPDSWSLVGERALTATLENEMENRHTKKQTLVFTHLHERVVEASSLQVGCEFKQQGALLLGVGQTGVLVVTLNVRQQCTGDQQTPGLLIHLTLDVRQQRNGNPQTPGLLIHLTLNVHQQNARD